MNRTAKLAFALLVSAVVMGLAFAYIPGLRIETMLTLRHAANFVGLADRDRVEEGRAAARRGDFATALERWRPLAERGDAAAQNHLGVAYELGDGVPKDDAIAVAWYRKAAEQGNDMAQAHLGEMYEKGKGVPQYYTIAATWYRKAAEACPKITLPQRIGIHRPPAAAIQTRSDFSAKCMSTAGGARKILSLLTSG